MIHHAFTVDLEDWFQGLTSTNPQIARWPSFESRVVGATQQLLAILRQHHVIATFFVLGYVADQHPGLIEQIAAEGHEIGIHGYHHRFVNRLTPDEFRRELAQTIEVVERITGKQPIGHRAPYFSIRANMAWAFACLQEFGICYDSSIFPTRSLLYGDPNAPRHPYPVANQQLVEFPISTLRMASLNWPVVGGFYTRLLPYCVTRWAIHQLQRQGESAIFYIHPWEVDTGQTYPFVTARERLTHYHGRRGLTDKLHRLLEDFHFVPLKKLYNSLAPTPST